MSESSRDLNLRLFLRYVADKKAPPQWLLEFIGAGVSEYLKNGKPWPSNAGRRPKGATSPDHSQLIKCFALSKIGADKFRIEKLLNLYTSDAAISSKTLSRNIALGLDFVSAENNGPVVYRFAIDELLAECSLTREERNSLEQIKTDLEIDEDEPSYE